ncbi:hypothetical protein GOBAR_AA07615 [Gossypium barbadense]|uniref:Uncharacterized protein n=1 Tax=Gossypium barbadense TaxID=3634 RepID=A0A2P5YBS1_GOSBA|nr:hypothetical protein GOBAR_AA07615 [Gossypium barbadense]
MTRLDRHFGLLNTSAQSSLLTLMCQMSPQGISSMLHMRIIESRHEFDPLQYRLARATDEDDSLDIPDDIPSFHEDPPSPPSPSHRKNIPTSLWVKRIHDFHVILDHDHSNHDIDHHDNLFAWRYNCGIQPLPPPSPLPSSTCASFTMTMNPLSLLPDHKASECPTYSFKKTSLQAEERKYDTEPVEKFSSTAIIDDDDVNEQETSSDTVCKYSPFCDIEYDMNNDGI